MLVDGICTILSFQTSNIELYQGLKISSKELAPKLLFDFIFFYIALITTSHVHKEMYLFFCVTPT